MVTKDGVVMLKPLEKKLRELTEKLKHKKEEEEEARKRCKLTLILYDENL